MRRLRGGTFWGLVAGLIWLLPALPLAAQTPQMSPQDIAPSWLSDTIAPRSPDVAAEIVTEDIRVMPIGPITRNAVGLLPARVTGFPSGLWGQSDSAELAGLFRRLPMTGPPAILDLTERLALSELDPPLGGNDAAADDLFLARIDMLLARGALEPARALIERAGVEDGEVFRRWFDVSLLLGQADRACAAMRASPDIAPTYPARIFCLARSGDWSAAALSMGTGVALGFITEDEADLIARFLDPELFEGEPPLPLDPDITPLRYVMRAAIAERPSSLGLPLAFAHADLAPQAGWRAQLDAAERLLRAGAIEPSQWLAIATSRRPSASGGIWERVAALQEFDASLLAGDVAAIARSLARVVDALGPTGLWPAFAQLYADPLGRQPLVGEAAILARKIELLSRNYESLALRAVPQSADEAVAFALARGQMPNLPATASPRVMALAAGFDEIALPDRYAPLITGNRAGEALLLAALTLSGDGADLDDLSDALRVLRYLGLEDSARRAALQLYLLPDRNG